MLFGKICSVLICSAHSAMSAIKLLALSLCLKATGLVFRLSDMVHVKGYTLCYNFSWKLHTIKFIFKSLPLQNVVQRYVGCTDTVYAVKKLWQIWQIALQSPQFYLPIILRKARFPYQHVIAIFQLLTASLNLQKELQHAHVPITTPTRAPVYKYN